MHAHYGISDENWSELASNHGVTEKNLLDSLRYFDPNSDGAELTKVSLMHFIDRKGDFQDKRNKLDHIAMAVFEELPIPEKVEVAMYVDWEDDDGES